MGNSRREADLVNKELCGVKETGRFGKESVFKRTDDFEKIDKLFVVELLDV